MTVTGINAKSFVYVNCSLSYTKVMMLRIYAEASDRLRLNTYLVVLVFTFQFIVYVFSVSCFLRSLSLVSLCAVLLPCA